MVVDGSGNVYVVGSTGSSGAGGNDLLIAKYNTSGSIQWQRTLGGTDTDGGYGIAVDGSGNLYVAGYTRSTGAGGADILIAKYNTSGSIQWQRTLGGTSEEFSNAIAVDGSGNVYVTGRTDSAGAGGYDLLIVKYNTSGSIQWQRTLGGTDTDAGDEIVVDGSGNVYVAGYTNSTGAGTNDALIVKYNSSGTIQWQRTLGGTNNDVGSGGIAVDSLGNVYVNGYTRSTGADSNVFLIAKLPGDGSLTGTYGSLTYASSSLTDSASSLTDASSSLTANTSYLTDASSSLTDAASNLTSSTTTLVSASGTVSASSGNTITLSDVSGTWSTGMKVQGVDSDTKDNPDPINPSALSLTSSEPATTQGSVTTWGNAQWQIAEDSGFTTNVQSLTSALTSSGTQTGPTGFTLDYNKNYYVRTKYGSSNPANIFSNWSVASLFKTGAEPFYVDDMFSTYLYEGNSSGQGANAQTINNGIDLAGEGGLVWIKNRTQGGTNAWSHYLFDTERGATKYIRSNDTGAEQTSNYSLSAFNSDGLTLGETSGMNNNGDKYVSWTFRKAPGFFDVVTYTGNGTSGRTVSHNLGSVPGMIIVKKTSGTGSWCVYHRSMGNSSAMFLQQTDAAFSSPLFNNTTPTSTEFTVNNGGAVNGSGQTYVAYIFAHDDQSFGTNGNESIIKCGSYTGTGSNGNFVDLGWEPQCIFVKGSSITSGWTIVDNMRGLNHGDDAILKANTTSSEADLGSPYNVLDPAPTGFIANGNFGDTNSNGSTYIYMAIRRPHKPATVATDVFSPNLASGYPRYPSGFVTDWVIQPARDSGGSGAYTRLTGNKALRTNNTDPEFNSSYDWAQMNGSGPDFTSTNYIGWSFRRAPGFFDVVAYTGTGSARTVSHNLGVAPELMIVKRRSDTGHWYVYDATLGNTYVNLLSAYSQSYTSSEWNNTSPTSSVFTVGTSAVNGSGSTFIAYLFATLDGISKVGSYTGTGSNVNVDCGFTAGARFVLIKRTDSTGDWYVWDTERGITNVNDPYLLLNEQTAEVTNTDYIDPLNAGFTVNSGAPAALNASGGEYLFLAIA